jgi:type II secretory pathway component PulF
MMNLDVACAALLPLGLMLGGVLVCWYATGRLDPLPAGSRPPLASPARGASMLSIGLRVLAGVLLVGGLIIGIVVTTQFFAIITVPVALLVLVITLRKYYEGEQQSLLWGLLTAAERGIPLDLAAQAFAEERNDVLAKRAAKLADYLEAGVPLGLALRRSGHRIDPAVSLAADLGYQTGTLGHSLRQVVDRKNVLETVTIPAASRLVYLGVVVVFTLIVQTFLMLKILPVFQLIHRDFSTDLPVATQLLIDSSQPGATASYFWLAFIVIGVAGLCVGLLSLLGFPLRSLPVVGRAWWRVDNSLVMRWLATGIRQGRPILEMLRLLAGYFPQAAVRRGLENTARRVEQGAHWCDGLLRARLIRSSESAVFQAAERAGNLPWALEEMADSAVRRWAYKLQVWMNIAFPLVLIALSCGILAVLLGAFMPLIALMQGLTTP